MYIQSITTNAAAAASRASSAVKDYIQAAMACGDLSVLGDCITATSEEASHALYTTVFSSIVHVTMQRDLLSKLTYRGISIQDKNEYDMIYCSSYDRLLRKKNRFFSVSPAVFYPFEANESHEKRETHMHITYNYTVSEGDLAQCSEWLLGSLYDIGKPPEYVIAKPTRAAENMAKIVLSPLGGEMKSTLPLIAKLLDHPSDNVATGIIFDCPDLINRLLH